jgi:hypothetical protein
MIEYNKVGLEFLDSAPINILLTAELNITPEALFKQFEDPGAWEWAGIKSVVWETEPPFGLGTTRTIDIAGQGKVQEYFLLWEQDKRMAFRFEKGEMKLVSTLVEDYQVDLEYRHAITRFRQNIVASARWRYETTVCWHA